MRNHMHRYVHSRIFLMVCVHTLLGHLTALWVHHFSFVDTQSSYSLPFMPQSFFIYKVYKGTRRKEESIKLLFPSILQTFCSLKYIFFPPGFLAWLFITLNTQTSFNDGFTLYSYNLTYQFADSCYELLACLINIKIEYLVF